MIEKEIDEIVQKLRLCGSVFANNRQRVAALGGAYMAASIEAAAPKSKKTHYRYNTSKANKRIRAPRGEGSLVAEYHPGNLGASIRVLRFPQAKTKVYVGSKLQKGQNPKGSFGPKRPDGYYLHMVEDGPYPNPFFRAAAQRAEPTVYKIMLREFRRIGAEFETKFNK